MKIIGICGSPKKRKSTTLFALQKAMDAVKAEGIKTDIINLARYTFRGCIDCGLCQKKLDCSQKDDFREHIMPTLDDPEVKGMIFASPVYFGGVTWLMKAFIDRVVPFRRNGFRFEDLIAGALTVGKARHGGQELTTIDIIKNCLIHNMIVVSDKSPTSHFGAKLWSGHPNGIEKDKIGIETAKNLGKKVAEIAKKIHS